MGYSTEDAQKHMAEMVDQQVGEDTEVNKAKEKVWTMKDEQDSTKGAQVHFDWDVNRKRMHLACPIGMDEVLKVSFD